MPDINAPKDSGKKSQSPIPVPAHLWDSFQTAMRECPQAHLSYAALVSYCLRRGEFRAVGEWITDFLMPNLWAAGLDRGFISDTKSDDAQTLHFKQES